MVGTQPVGENAMLSREPSGEAVTRGEATAPAHSLRLDGGGEGVRERERRQGEAGVGDHGRGARPAGGRGNHDGWVPSISG
jgi:hypothetical protein